MQTFVGEGVALNTRDINIKKSLVVIAVLLLGLALGKLISIEPFLAFVLMVGLLTALLTVFNTNIALIILVISMFLSPEITIAKVPSRAIVVRIDDLLLAVIFFTWIAKMAINKQLGLIRRTPLNWLIVAYTVVYIVSTSIGIGAGRVHLLKSFFYILKYIEYFLLYFLVSNNIRSKKQIKTFIVFFLITCVITCVYAIATVGVAGRATAPFEGTEAEPNTLGGYLVFIFAIIGGIFLYTDSARWRFWCVALAGLSFFTLLQTLSRGSFLAFIPMYLTLVFFTRRKRAFLIGLLILSVFILPVVVPAKVTERIRKTFTMEYAHKTLNEQTPLDESATARLKSWREVVKKWKERPLLGYGVTGVGLVDGQYPRILGETGIIGSLIFLWLIFRIFINTFKVFNSLHDDWLRGLTLGFLAGFISLLSHSLFANTFIIVRIMEPFWFLAAVVMMLPSISKITPPKSNII